MTIMFSKLPQFDLDKIVVRPETVFDSPVNMNRNINFFHNRSLEYEGASQALLTDL